MLFPGQNLAKYQGTARLLHKLRYYKGLTKGMESCMGGENSFLIIDCPSGTGETLAGVAFNALSLLDHRQSPQALICRAPVAVFHLVWQDAVGCQHIYQEIVEESGINDLFFEPALAFD